MRALIVAALAAGCGADVASPPLASDARAGSDAAALAPIIVDVRGRFFGVPVADAIVAFIPPGGPAVVVPTDVAGRASAAMPAGATVAIARAEFGQAQLTVFVDVPPGAALIDGPPLTALPGGPDLGDRQATVAPYIGVAQVSASCGGSGGGFGGEPLAWRQAGCARASDGTVVATGADPVGQRQYAAQRHVDLRDAAVVELPAWRPMTTTAVVLTSIPESVVSASVALTQDDGDVIWNRDFVAAPIEGASLVLAVPTVPEPVAAQLELVAAGAEQEVRLVGRRAPTAPRVAIDLGSAAPPWLGPPALDLASRTVTWRYQGGGGRRPDVVLATLSLSSNDGALTLRLIAPGTATAVVVPRLPPELAAWDLAATSAVFDRGIIGVDIVGVTDYATAASAVDQAAWRAEQRGVVEPLARDRDWWITGR